MALFERKFDETKAEMKDNLLLLPLFDLTAAMLLDAVEFTMLTASSKTPFPRMFLPVVFITPVAVFRPVV